MKWFARHISLFSFATNRKNVCIQNQLKHILCNKNCWVVNVTFLRGAKLVHNDNKTTSMTEDGHDLVNAL